nr:T9SS type A sorting domain-containing protein [uncultured Dyadobacter sp.]
MMFFRKLLASNRLLVVLLFSVAASRQAFAQVHINLAKHVDASSIPEGSSIEWHRSSTPNSPLSTAEVAAAPPGIYYAFAKNGDDADCYSVPSAVRFVSGPCVGGRVNLSDYVNPLQESNGYEITYHTGLPVNDQNRIASPMVDIGRDTLKTYYVSARSQDGSCYSTASPIVVGNECALPVELISFEAERIERSVSISWRTASEINASHFEVQRSGEGKSWVSIANVAASNPEKGGLPYQYMDAKPLVGTSYYRLRMVDADSSFAYSRIAPVRFSAIETSNAYYFPNPTEGLLQISGVPLQQINHVKCIDFLGKTVYESLKWPEKGLDLKGLGAGQYIMELRTSDGETIRKKIVIR